MTDRSSKVVVNLATDRENRRNDIRSSRRPRVLGEARARTCLASDRVRKSTRMPGASRDTRRVKNLNANWVPGPDGDDGCFALMIITDDDQQVTLSPSPAAVTAVIALARADTVLVWDPVNRTLIAANLIGEMPWTTRP